MDQGIKISVIEHFKGICDPRREPLHPLSEALTIILCATIAGADNIVGIVKWAERHIAWLQDILELPYGLPSHDTLGRILSIMEPNEFEQCFINWTNAVFKKTHGDIIPIDGKLLRGSYNTKSNVHAINVVGAFSTANGVLLGQVKTETKSNEIIAIPQLLKMLDIHGCIITIDAMGCQTEIASKIVEGGGDYVLAVKDNQPTLHVEIQEAFEEAIEKNPQKIDFYETNEKGHGREETRRYYLINDIEDLEKTDDFSGCASIGMVESLRTVNGETSKEKRYFILSFITIASFFAKCVRHHWRIENSLHWVLDVAFREDESRIRKDNAPANMGTIRRVGLNMIKQEKTEKVGVENKRRIAGWDTKYLEKIIGLC
jgi:predicted transposase YbfD/YdcC